MKQSYYKLYKYIYQRYAHVIIALLRYYKKYYIVLDTDVIDVTLSTSNTRDPLTISHTLIYLKTSGGHLPV